MNGKTPTKENVSKLLIKNLKYLVYAIGTEESMRSIFQSFFYSNKDQWIKMLRYYNVIISSSEVLGPDFVFIKEENLSAIHLALFVHRSIKEDITSKTIY